MSAKEVFILPPEIQSDKFEDHLATDALFVDYLNAFLQLPTFKDKYRFNSEDCCFELVSSVKRDLLHSISRAAARVKSKDDIYEAVRSVTCDPHLEYKKLCGDVKHSLDELTSTYDVQCLNTEQGLQWTREEKLPRFLTSDVYSEYRLMKVVSQVSVGDGRPVQLVDVSPVRTPRGIVSATQRKAAIREKIAREQRAKADREAEAARVAQEKQQAALAKLVKARDPTLPSQEELAQLNVDPGHTPDAEMRKWFSDVKKAQNKSRGATPRSSLLNRPTSASSGITRPGTALQSEPAASRSSSRTDYVATPRSEAESRAENDLPEVVLESDPVVNRPRSGVVCQVDQSETKEGLLHEDTIHLDKDGEISGSVQFSKPEPKEAEEAEKPKQKKEKKPIRFAADDCQKFKDFIHNTAGKLMFDFWLALDKCLFASSDEDFKKGLCEVKEKYCSISSDSVLPSHFRNQNNLRHITSFSRDQIRNLQLETIRPLVLYWVPKYLNHKKDKFRETLEKDEGYSTNQKMLRPLSSVSYPEPKTPLALPLRPKSCVPQQLFVSEESPKMEMPERKVKSRPKSAVENSQKPPVPPPSKANRVKSASVAKLPASRNASRAGSAMSEGREAAAAAIESDEEPELAGIQVSQPSTRPTTAAKTPAKSQPPPRDEDDDEAASVASYGSTVKEFDKFIGSAKMETLLHTLKAEFNDSGGVFKNFLQQSGNKLWINHLHFWHDLQRYHSLFFKQVLDSNEIVRKAKAIYSLYVVLTAPFSIKCSREIRRRITLQVNKPCEEMFDQAEEYSIHTLCEPWIKLLESEEFAYSKIEQYSVKKPLDIDPDFLKRLKSQGLIKLQQEVEDEEEQVDEERVREEYYNKLWCEIPEDYRGWTFDEMLKNRMEFEYLRKFIADHYGTTDLACWVDIEGFKRMAHEDDTLRDTKAKDIKVKYLTKKYFFGPNSPATSKEQEHVLALAGGWGKQIVPERPPNVMLFEVEKYVRERLERKWLAMFLATPGFASRQSPKLQASDSVDDLVQQKKRKQLQLSKVMESKWVSSSREVIQFRKALMNPVTSEQFKKYVRIVTKENFLENDISFWQEVQRFKELFHQHADDSLVVNKVAMIVSCFLESIVPPAIQIDVSAEQASEMIDKRRKPTAYMFRDAQLTVFRVLYPHWAEFCRFRHRMKNVSKVEATLERKSARQRTRARKATQRALDGSGPARRDSSDGAQFNAAATMASNLMDDIIMSQADNVTSWKYSAYLEALQRQQACLQDDARSRVSDTSSAIGPAFPA